MGADHYARLPGGNRLAGSAALGSSQRSRQERHLGGLRLGLKGARSSQPSQERGDGRVVLLGEDLRRRKQGGLPPSVDDRQHGAQRHQCLS